MKRTAATVIAFAALAAPASAAAAARLPVPRMTVPRMAVPLPRAKPAQERAKPARLTLNVLSDRRALYAYASYLEALLGQETAGQANDTAYITTISQPNTGGCKAALWKLTQPPYQLDTKAQHTLTVLGQEIGDDITINFDSAATVAFNRFAGILRSLHWTRLSGGGPVVRHYVNNENAVLALPTSNLCLDAAYAELHPETVPDSTRVFLEVYNRTSNQANLALASLTMLMQAYEIPGEKALVARISTLAGELSARTKADLLQSGTALTSVLESE